MTKFKFFHLLNMIKLNKFEMHRFGAYIHTHTHIYIYIYIYICVSLQMYIH